MVLAHNVHGDTLEDLQNNPCYQKIAPEGLKCVKAVDGNFDADKMKTDCGISDVGERCCALGVVYDCFVNIGQVCQANI